MGGLGWREGFEFFLEMIVATDTDAASFDEIPGMEQRPNFRNDGGEKDSDRAFPPAELLVDEI